MHKNDGTNATPGGEFTDGVPNVTPRSIMESEWCNTVQRELVNAVEGAGLTLDPDDDAQLYQAIVAIAAGAVASNGEKVKVANTTGARVFDGLAGITNDNTYTAYAAVDISARVAAIMAAAVPTTIRAVTVLVQLSNPGGGGTGSGGLDFWLAISGNNTDAKADVRNARLHTLDDDSAMGYAYTAEFVVPVVYNAGAPNLYWSSKYNASKGAPDVADVFVVAVHY